MDGDTVVDKRALISVMARIMKDPDRIIGAGSYFGLLNGLEVKDGRITKKSFSYNPIIAYQNIEYLRSFIGNRLAWSSFNATPCVAGGFSVWRRDMLMELGGFDSEYSSEDIVLTFKAHEYMTRNKREYSILTLPYCAGWTYGPPNIKSLIQQRNRWQRVKNETLWRYKHMILNPRYKWFAMITLPYFLLYESLGIFFEIASVGIVLWAYLAGILDGGVFLAYLSFMILSQAFISILSICSYSRDYDIFDIRYTSYLMFLSFFELLLYRWAISAAKIRGTIDYLRGVRAYDQFART
jgi:cellulose synthase/poly-beta-1,6-N-acetylglucosamine synthase-like glycosyltransferase